jgi:hypothetical protein
MTTPGRDVVSAYVWGACGAAGAFAALVGLAILRVDGLPNAGWFGLFTCMAGIGGGVASISSLVSLRRRS